MPRLLSHPHPGCTRKAGPPSLHRRVLGSIHFLLPQSALVPSLSPARDRPALRGVPGRVPPAGATPGAFLLLWPPSRPSTRASETSHVRFWDLLRAEGLGGSCVLTGSHWIPRSCWPRWTPRLQCKCRCFLGPYPGHGRHRSGPRSPAQSPCQGPREPRLTPLCQFPLLGGVANGPRSRPPRRQLASAG